MGSLDTTDWEPHFIVGAEILSVAWRDREGQLWARLEIFEPLGVDERRKLAVKRRAQEMVTSLARPSGE